MVEVCELVQNRDSSWNSESHAAMPLCIHHYYRSAWIQHVLIQFVGPQTESFARQEYERERHSSSAQLRTRISELTTDHL